MITKQEILEVSEQIRKERPGSKEYLDLVNKKLGMIREYWGTPKTAQGQDTFSPERNEHHVHETVVASSQI